MAWTAPLTAVSNAALTAAQWNASVRDDLLTTGPALATTAGSHFAATGANSIAERIPVVNSNAATGTTTSTSYTALLTGVSGALTVTATTGPVAFWMIGSRQQSSVNGANVFTSCAISGATSLSSNSSKAISVDTTGQTYHGITVMENALNPGSNVFNMQQAVSSGTGTFSDRRIQALPF